MELNINQNSQEPVLENTIKIIGVGGAGNNAVNHMYERRVNGLDYVVCNTDIQDLEHSSVPNRLQIGIKLTEGLGAGSIPEYGKKAAEESEAEIRELYGDNTSMVILASGMGGGTGTGATPVFARIAKEMNIVVVAIVTTPFGFERKRIKEAIQGIEDLEAYADALLIINNEKLQQIYGDLSFPVACEKANDVLVMAAKSISELVTHTAEQNIDYADLETMLRGSGLAVFGVGRAKGKDRIRRAIEEALYSPLLDNCDIMGAKSLLVNIVLAPDYMTVEEKRSIGKYMQRMAGRYEEMKTGTRIDDSLEEGEIIFTIIATNFEKEPEREAIVEPTKPIELEENWLKAEDTARLEREAREKKERQEQKLAEREKKERVQVVAKQEQKTVSQEEKETFAERKDMIEEIKKQKTNKKSKNTTQQLLGLIFANDVEDDVEM